jgi:protoporphyrinogen oxidase
VEKIEYLILGGGVGGISASYHLGHENCLVLEKTDSLFGVLKSSEKNGFTWDRGPHVSFTKNRYVADLFANNVSGKYVEIEASPINYYKGMWIDHPVQTNLFQVPEELRERCLQSFMQQRSLAAGAANEIKNYDDWLHFSLGSEITENFVAPYTRKYWTTEPGNLTIDWIGPRMHVPTVESIADGALGPATKSKHYITKIRYPQTGGYQAFVAPLAEGVNARLNHEVKAICLDRKRVSVVSGEVFSFEKLIVALPLPVFLAAVEQSTPNIIEESRKLSCSSVNLVNVEIPHSCGLPTQWFYVYDEELLTSRVTIMNHLSEKNSPRMKTGIQVEVYESRYRELKLSEDELVSRVLEELVTIGVTTDQDLKYAEASLDFLDQANIIFDQPRCNALNKIFDFLKPFGYATRRSELHPLNDWAEPYYNESGSLYLVGRYAEWKYYWTDDCILSGRSIAEAEHKC